MGKNRMCEVLLCWFYLTKSAKETHRTLTEINAEFAAANIMKRVLADINESWSIIDIKSRATDTCLTIWNQWENYTRKKNIRKNCLLSGFLNNCKNFVLNQLSSFKFQKTTFKWKEIITNREINCYIGLKLKCLF